MKTIVERVYWDVIKNPKLYPTAWIKSTGLPYWIGLLEQYPEVKKIIDLYESMIKD